MKRTLVLLLLTLPLYCQSLSFGIKAGVPLTDALSIANNLESATTHRWTFGPTVELGLPGGASIGLDALYRSYDYSAPFTNSSTWHLEFPLYLKYRFGNHLLRPFVEAGVAFDYGHTTGRSGCSGEICAAANLTPFALSQSGFGGLVGGGVEIKAPFVKIAPEIRYTRWQRGAFSGSSTASGGGPQAAVVYPPPTGQPNQVEVFVGIRF
jgi:hypothetical protein